MKEGRELDAIIAVKIMGLKAIEPENIPHYSTDIFAAYKIISKLLRDGWFCKVSSRISKDGSLFYKANFHQHGRECERFATTIPMAVCTSAMAVVKDEYFEYTDVLNNVTDDQPIEIVPGTSESPAVMVDDDTEIIIFLKEIIEKNLTNCKDGEELAKIILDGLIENNYTIVRKPTDIK